MILYTKYSNDRDPRFQIRTDILEENGARFVVKSPASRASLAHVASLKEKEGLLNESFAGTEFIANKADPEGDAVRFAFLRGDTVEEKLDELLNGEESALEGALLGFLTRIDALGKEEFHATEEFRSVFGNHFPSAPDTCASVTDIDLVLNNLIPEGDHIHVIDYEWTFYFPVPLRYVKWRILNYYVYGSSKRLFLRDRGIFRKAGIFPEEEKLFSQMESSFQAYVAGETTPLFMLYPDISEGCLYLDDMLQGKTGRTTSPYVTVYADRGEGFQEETSERYRIRDGKWQKAFDLTGIHALRIDPTESRCIVRVARLHIGKHEAAFETTGTVTDKNRILFTEPDPQILIGNLSGENGVLEAALYITHEEADILGEYTKTALRADTLNKELKEAKERCRVLETTLEDKKNRYLHTRNAAIHREELAALYMSGTAMKAYRKVLQKMGKADPFESLRPLSTEEETGMHICVDRVAYRRGEVVVRGWAYDENDVPPAVLVRDRTRILKHSCSRFPRHDVNGMFGLHPGALTGFSVNVPLSEIRRPALSVEFENEFGYVRKMVDVLMDEAARDAYMQESLVPVDPSDSVGYNDWVHDRLATDEELEKERKTVFPYMPKISICIPLYNTDSVYLAELMDGLLHQSYSHIEICLADGSPDDGVMHEVSNYTAKDKRILYRRLEKNEGISGNTNRAFEMATGDFIMLCDHDDTLEKNAVFEIVKAINKADDVDVIYTDEDKLMTEENLFFSPNFKPDFNYDLLRSNNYITHIFCVRKAIVDEVGGERAAFDGAQDYDFILRCVEKARRIVHVPKFLYHWRAHALSTAGNPESKLYAYENGRRAIEAHYDRMKIPATVSLTEDYGSYRSIYKIQGEPLVSIIIPNKDMKDILKRCLDSIFTRSTYGNYEIIIAENNSTKEETFRYYEELTASHANAKVVRWEGVFNYSAINNFAVKSAKGEYLLFLNNDIEVITDRWIEEMLGYAQRADVGCVGARLYYPDDTLQHCGVVVGIGGIAGHIMSRAARTDGGYFGRIVKTQDVSAVTAACMMMPRDVFERVGGFEESFEVAYNDVDLCLKVRNEGLLVVYNAWAELYHHESYSRGSDEASADPVKHERQMKEAGRLRKRWPDIFRDGDPYFNPNLDYNAAFYILEGTVPGHTGLAAVKEAMEKDGE
jgi:GT2 family glycosyltransferase